MKIRDRIKEFRRVKASELRPNPKNWRTHPKGQQEALRGVLAEIGYADALLARELPDGTLELVDGHLRAETTPDQDVPVLVLDVNEEEAAKLLATLDPLASLAETDADALRSLLDQVETDSDALQEMLDQLAADAGIVEPEPEVTEDDVPPVPVDPITKPGDLWLLGRHRLLCGDSTKAEDVDKLVGDNLVDLVWTDPPYGVCLNDVQSVSEAKKLHRRLDGQIIHNDDLKPEDLRSFLYASLRIAYDKSRPGAVWYIAAPSGDIFGEFAYVLGREGINVWRHTLVWVKDRLVLGRADYHYRHESIMYGWKPGAGHRMIEDRTQDTVWEIKRPGASPEHPSMKPVELIARAITNSSLRGEKVYDPFLGSGTTMIAAEQLERTCYGMELSRQYADVCCVRWSTLTGEQPILNETGETFAQVKERRSCDAKV